MRMPSWDVAHAKPDCDQVKLYESIPFVRFVQRMAGHAAKFWHAKSVDGGRAISYNELTAPHLDAETHMSTSPNDLLSLAGEILANVYPDHRCVAILIVGRDPMGRLSNLPVGSVEEWLGCHRILRAPTTGERIIAVLKTAARPLKGKTIAGRAGLHFGGHFRSTMSDLVRAGDIHHIPGQGYWPADREAPPSAA